MAKFVAETQVHVSIKLNLTEAEAHALNSLTAYGNKAFLEVFYTKLGRSVLQEHEAGLLTLFDSIRQQLPQILGKAIQARKVFQE